MYPICAVSVVFFETPTPVWRITLCTRCTLTISLYGGDSHNTNSFVHCAGEAAKYLLEGNHYVALSQEKSEEIWRKRTSGSGGDVLWAGISGVSPSLVEEFPTLRDLKIRMFLHFGVQLPCRRSQPPRPLLCKILRSSLSLSSQT